MKNLAPRKRIIVAVFLFAIIFLLPISIYLVQKQRFGGNAYYVATNGNDSNPGTIGSPFKTLSKAASTVQPGDTVYIREGIYYESVEPQKSGAKDAYITFQGYENDQVTIADDYFPLDIVGDIGYLQFKNLHFQATSNKDWSAAARLQDTTTTAPHHIIFDNVVFKGQDPITNVRQFGVMMRAHDTPITNITIRNSQVTHNNSHGIFLYGMTYNIDIGPNNNIGYNGWGLGSPTNPVYAHGIEIHSEYPGYQDRGAQHIRVFENEIHHNDMQGIRSAFCRYIHIKDNYFHHNGATGINVENQVDYAVIEDNLSEHNVQVYPHETGIWLDESDYVVIQRNILRGNKYGLMTQGTNQIIIRNNEIYENNRGAKDIWQAMSMYLSWGNNDNIIVHNTLYDNCDSSGPFGDLTIARTDSANRPLVKNNIISEGNCEYDLWVDLVADYQADYNNYYNNRPLAVYWKGNSVSWSQYLHLSGQDSHSQTSNPLLTNPGQHNFNLQSGSPNIDAGDFLTKTTSAGNGVVIQLEDSRYFTDGMGIVEGDLVKVGSNNLVRIIEVNYETNTITVDQSISWNGGDGVSYPYSGSAPDIGAHEYGASQTPVPTLTPTPIPTSPPHPLLPQHLFPPLLQLPPHTTTSPTLIKTASSTSWITAF